MTYFTLTFILSVGLLNSIYILLANSDFFGNQENPHLWVEI